MLHPAVPHGEKSHDVGVTDDARRLLAKVIGDQDFDGRDELLAQVPYVEVVGGPVTFRKIGVDRQCVPRSDTSLERVPGEAWAFGDDGQPIGTLVVWIDDGYISALEYGWVSDAAPTELPNPDKVRSRR